jgi:ankyrin repeat protein
MVLMACARGDAPAVEILLGAGGRFDGTTWQGYNAMGHACRIGQLGIVRLLLGKGASPIEKDATGTTALELAELFCEAEGEQQSIRIEIRNLLKAAAGTEFQ